MSTVKGVSLVAAGSARLHVELTGQGPEVLLVPGAGGDAGQYTELAKVLAQSHTVVSYDRRNNARSPQQPDWAETSIEQQAGDVIALLDALGIDRCGVYGNSTGAVIALAAVLRAPSRFSGAVLHEPALLSVLADPSDAMASIQPVIAAGVQEGGLAGGAEAFVRFAAGEASALLPPDVVERLRANARILLEVEFGAFSGWKPEPQALAALKIPLTVLSAEETAPFFVEAATWIAGHAGVQLDKVPGGHMGFLDHPLELAAAIRAATA
ncbi:alpha/beta fold hydrolase [Pseudarthrobacter sp. N5]|uniref:alpha/beta fold hydrolase n=1 Tax=Pseudarthrobacter sp. N5 TaxID=3418416 RepID=UPI003CFAA961